jgi:thioester reductase-like protein
VLPYSQLKAANVGGTHEVLRLATHGYALCCAVLCCAVLCCCALQLCAASEWCGYVVVCGGVRSGKLKPVHHISTLSVIPPGRYEHAVTEVEPLVSSVGLHEGYAQSKWVADQLVLRAAERRLPVTIYRPGRITGHTKTGVTSVEDFMCRIVKGCIQLGVAPDLDWLLDMTPVDFCADAIVHLALMHPLPVQNSPFKVHTTPAPSPAPSVLCPVCCVPGSRGVVVYRSVGRSVGG